MAKGRLTWNCYTIALISHASKVMLKILQARLQQYVNRELPDVQAGFRKGRGIRDQIANIHWIIKKARNFQKNMYFCFIYYADCVDHIKLENSERDGNTRPPDLPLEKSVCRSGRNSQNWTWNNRLVPKMKRSTSRLYIATLLIYLLCRVHHEKRWTGRTQAGIKIARSEEHTSELQSPKDLVCRLLLEK